MNEKSLQSGDFSEIERFCTQLHKTFPRLILSNLCYVPPSLEFLGPTALPVIKPDWRPCGWPAFSFAV